MPKIEYSLSKTTGSTYEELLKTVPELLKEEGFGILTEIDVKATLKKKIDVDFKKYMILGACNPRLAYQAFQAENDIGVMLPCNVVVYEDDDGKGVVVFIDPIMALGVIGNEDLTELAKEANTRLRRVMDKL